jgi:hypothetical protein
MGWAGVGLVLVAEADEGPAWTNGFSLRMLPGFLGINEPRRTKRADETEDRNHTDQTKETLAPLLLGID